MTVIAPEIICTHEGDLDGLLSALLLRRLAKKRFGLAPRIEAFHNNYWKSRNPGEKVSWITDLAFEKRLDRPHWMVVDHHPPECAPLHAKLVHDAAKSSGLLSYELCLEEGLGSEVLARLVHLNNVSDLFLDADPEFDLACDYAHLVKIYGFWNVFQLIEGEPERLLHHPLLEVMEVKRRVEDPLGYEWSRGKIESLGPGVAWVPTTVGNPNLIVHRMLKDPSNPYPVLVTLFRKGNGTMLASFRSRGGQALAAAVAVQGGGHPNAAGATLPKSINSAGEAARYLRVQLTGKIKPVAAEGKDDLEQAFKDI
ncbi:MAG: DHH family phosphoesterase [Verrucomicrobia bacterium]|nr:DHH family phosphoesterase [Verrucomicrobiota bacterium]